jgi:alkylhydroperoxidase family enzyme
MYLKEPEHDAAVEAGYATNTADSGYLMNYAHAWAWRQDVSDHFLAARKTLAGQTTLSAGEIAAVNAAVAGARRDTACSLAWGTKLAAQTSPVAAAAVLGGETTGLSERERAIAVWAARVARDPNATSQADIDGLKAAGFDEREIAEATMLAVFRLAFTAYNASLGVEPDQELKDAAPAEVRRAAGYGADAYSNVAS